MSTLPMREERAEFLPLLSGSFQSSKELEKEGGEMSSVTRWMLIRLTTFFLFDLT